MKLIHLYNKLIFFFIVFISILYSSLVFGKEDGIEKKFKDLTSKLRCMTCQNQTIYDSDADFSKDIKKIIRQKLNKGQSEREIIKFIEMRYGEYILFKPKFDKKNIFLWAFPFIILTLSSVFLFIKIRKNNISK